MPQGGKPQAAKESEPESAEQPTAAPREAKPQAPKEAAKQPAAATTPEEAAAPKEAEPQAPEEAAEQPAAAAAPKEAKPQAPKVASKQPPAPPKEAKPQAPVDAAKEAKPQATKEAKERARQQPAEQWLQGGATIPGWDAESEATSSGGHSATFSAGEIAELTDVEQEAYKTGGPPPPNAKEWDIPRELGIAPVGRSWQNRQWRRMYGEQYRTAARNVARGMAGHEGNRVKFHVTTDAAPAAYYYVEGKKTASEAEEFHWLEEWSREQEDALGAEAEAKKGQAADQPSGKKATKAEKGHAAHQPPGEKTTQVEKGHAGDKATQGSGGSTQKLWSEPEPARKKAPRSSVGQPILGDEWDTDKVEEWWKESETIAHRIRVGRCRERTPEPNPVERQKAREEARRKMQAGKAEDKMIFDGMKRRDTRHAAENEAVWMARIRETEREQGVRLSARWVENVANVRAPSGAPRNRQLQSSNTALDDFRERGRTLRSLHGALRRAGWLLAGRAGRLLDYPQAYHSPRDEGALDPSRPNRHSYVVAVDREDEQTWIPDLLHLHPAQDLALSFR